MEIINFNPQESLTDLTACLPKSYSVPQIGFPEWLGDIFIRFSAEYKDFRFLINDERTLMTKKLEWYNQLQFFDEQVIRKACESYITTVQGDVLSLSKFLEFCKSEKRRVSEFFDYKEKFTEVNKKPHVPVAPLLGEYMLANPRKEDDAFKKIFASTKPGKERGRAVIAEIKRKLSGKQTNPV